MDSSILMEEKNEGVNLSKVLRCVYSHVYWSPVQKSQDTDQSSPFAGEWTEKMIYTMEYLWPVKKSEIPLSMTT